MAKLRFFLCYIPGGIVFVITVLIGWVILLEGGPHVRTRLSHWRALGTPIFFWIIRKFMALKVRYRMLTPERVPHLRGGPCIVVSNHQAAVIEPFVLPNLLYQLGIDDLRWVAKEKTREAVGYGLMHRHSGFAFLSRDRSRSEQDIREIERMTALASNEGASVAIFPEGTRTTDGNPLPPKSGGLKAIVRNLPHAPIVSVTFGWDRLPGDIRTIKDGAGLYKRTLYVTVRIDDPLTEETAEAWLNAEWERKQLEVSASVT